MKFKTMKVIVSEFIYFRINHYIREHGNQGKNGGKVN